MTTPSPAEQFASDLATLQSKIASLQDGTRLNHVRDTVEDLQTTVNGLTVRIGKLRERGYAFEKDLEGQAAEYARQWAALYAPIVAQINQQSAGLAAALQLVEAQLAQLAGQQPGAVSHSLLESLQTRVVTLEENVSAAQRQIEGMFDGFGRQVGTLTGQLDQVEWMLTQLSEAKFTLLPTESGIAAVKAVWCKEVKPRDDDPAGVLYLTDQRLIFEEKDEIVTKKVLFVATEKQKVQEMKWDVAVALLEESKPSKAGLLRNEDHLDLTFASGAAIQSAHVHIWQDGNIWVQLLNRAKTKDFDSTRAIAIDPAELAKVKSVPSQCPSCGGNISQVVLRGQDDVKCQYCGFIIHL